jgi:hypothetical protein
VVPGATSYSPGVTRPSNRRFGCARVTSSTAHCGTPTDAGSAVAIVWRRSSAVRHFRAPSTRAQLAAATRLSTPGVTVPSAERVSSSWVPPRISSRPTRDDGSTIAATAASPDIFSLTW